VAILNALIHVMSYSNSCCYCFFQAQYFTFHVFSPSQPIFSLKCLSIWHCALFILSPLIWLVFCYHCISFDLKVLNIIHPTNLYTASFHNLNSLYLKFWYYLWCFPSHSGFQLKLKFSRSANLFEDFDLILLCQLLHCLVTWEQIFLYQTFCIACSFTDCVPLRIWFLYIWKSLFLIVAVFFLFNLKLMVI